MSVRKVTMMLRESNTRDADAIQKIFQLRNRANAVSIALETTARLIQIMDEHGNEVFVRYPESLLREERIELLSILPGD